MNVERTCPEKSLLKNVLIVKGTTRHFNKNVTEIVSSAVVVDHVSTKYCFVWQLTMNF